MAVRAGTSRGLPQETIDEIVRRVLTVARPDRIILFGSAATGGMTPDSDVDLLVVERDPGRRASASATPFGASGTLSTSSSSPRNGSTTARTSSAASPTRRTSTVG
jgi:hypothetical protein